SLLIVTVCFSLVGCQNSNKSSSSNGQNKVRMNGSTSMEKLVNGLSEVIREEYPDLLVEPQFTGSSAGIESLINGTTDIGTSSRALTEEEQAKGIVGHVVAIDGIAIITNPSNTLDGISKEALIAIYQGTIRNWSQLGGPNQPIVVIGREAGSGTRGAFEEILDVVDTCSYAQEVNETGAVVAKVASIPGAIGYVSLDVIGETTKALEIDNVKISEETIKDGSYKIQRPFIMATNGSLEEQNESIQEVFTFIDSEKGQKLIASVGLVSGK
ncbi:MAG: phosphate ABC transporter substrate-binding protein, partial [Coprobacillaceae bacterium]